MLFPAKWQYSLSNNITIIPGVWIPWRDGDHGGEDEEEGGGEDGEDDKNYNSYNFKQNGFREAKIITNVVHVTTIFKIIF